MRENLSTTSLYEHGLREDHTLKLSATGALVAYSGTKTGRSPKDKRIVLDQLTEDIWWGPVNKPLNKDLFIFYRDWAIKYLFRHPTHYVVDATAGWDYEFSLKIKTHCTSAYHALFMRNMLIPSTEKFNVVDFTIYNVGEVDLSEATKDLIKQSVSNTDNFPMIDHSLGNTLVAIDFTRKEMIIFGTKYAGEMKKGILTLFMYLMPLSQALPLHSSANIDGIDDSTCLFFGLSGTGKTTISADPDRKLIGDDEHVWTDKGVFNIEGGCYAKCIGLNHAQEPEIFDAIKFGTVLENVVLDRDGIVDYNDISITPNTRASYPLDHIDNVALPSLGKHPKDIILLVCDAFGVLPPIAKLSPEQAVYFFVNGYTSKIPGTEMGITQPQMVFSACFGQPFLVHHPKRYGELLRLKLKQHNSQAWLINTGWIGGGYGVGKRISLRYTRRMVDAIHLGEFNSSSTKFWKFPHFEIEIPNECEGIPEEILNPKSLWENNGLYDEALEELWLNFEENNSKYVEF